MSAIKDKQAWLICLLRATPVLVTLAYALGYWTHSHAELARFYLNLNPVFYRFTEWSNNFFTEGIKSQGNWWCAGALAAALYLAWQWKPYRLLPKAGTVFLRLHLGQLFIIILAGMALALKAWLQAQYSSDEVFSAVALAQLPPFQAASYYPLPNHHVFFNLLNGLLAFATDDLVFSGRIMAMASYLSVLVLTFFFFVKMNNSSWLSLLFTLLIAVQFPIWGWSAQARGYAPMLLFGVLSLLAARRQLPSATESNNVLFPLAVALGMFTHPAFLFWWAGLFAGGALILWNQRKSAVRWMKQNATAGALALLLYLPLLTFSGLKALTANPYVQSSSEGPVAFLQQLHQQRYLAGLFNEWMPQPCPPWAPLLLLVAALLFLFRSGKRQGELAWFTVGIVATTILMVLALLKAPFYRVFIVHGWFFWIVLLSSLAPATKTTWRYFLLPVLVSYTLFAAFTNRRLIPMHLYYYDVNAQVQRLSHCPIGELEGKTLGLSDESFYWWALLKDKAPTLQYGTAQLKGRQVLIVHESEKLHPEQWGYVERSRCEGFVFFEK